MTTGDLGTILSIWAHPDDETYGCAGLMAQAVLDGGRVVCVTATRGELGSTDPERWPPGTQLADVRTKELAACLAELGVTEHIWLDYRDGGCDQVPDEEAIGRLHEIVQAVAPDTVLTFGPDGGTYHPDHIAVSRWTTAAVAGTDAQLHYSAITPEWIARMTEFVDLSTVMMADREPVIIPAERCSIHVVHEGDVLDMKWRAMLRQESQIGPMLAALGPDNFRALLAEESFCAPREFPLI
ncbi:MAG TPA: PIG-L family deacetylase [Jatrophihabitantaceae bacterium]|jgi:LmbE family N-acetylglucosaminyl deacetylase